MFMLEFILKASIRLRVFKLGTQRGLQGIAGGPLENYNKV